MKRNVTVKNKMAIMNMLDINNFVLSRKYNNDLEHKHIPLPNRALFRIINDPPSNVALVPMRKTPDALLTDMLTELSVSSTEFANKTPVSGLVMSVLLRELNLHSFTAILTCSSESCAELIYTLQCQPKPLLPFTELLVKFELLVRA